MGANFVFHLWIPPKLSKPTTLQSCKRTSTLSPLVNTLNACVFLDGLVSFRLLIWILLSWLVWIILPHLANSVTANFQDSLFTITKLNLNRDRESDVCFKNQSKFWREYDMTKTIPPEPPRAVFTPCVLPPWIWILILLADDETGKPRVVRIKIEIQKWNGRMDRAKITCKSKGWSKHVSQSNSCNQFLPGSYWWSKFVFLEIWPTLFMNTSVHVESYYGKLERISHENNLIFVRPMRHIPQADFSRSIPF